MTEFFMPMLPPTATHQTQGHTVDKRGVHHFYKRNNGEAEAKLAAHLMKHIPEQPYTGAIQVVCKWCFPIKGRHTDGEPYTGKPDVDNLCKSLYDIMSRLGYWKDDRLIVSGVTEKFWAETPGIYISIREVTA
jgi:Holliday junction resolvase RusA-like endonuclease